MNISYNNPGNNQLSSINFTIQDPDYINYRLLNKEVEFFVKEGGGESSSIFLGFISWFNSHGFKPSKDLLFKTPKARAYGLKPSL